LALVILVSAPAALSRDPSSVLLRGLVGLLVTLLALRSRAYATLSEQYQLPPQGSYLPLR
jgi:hypothetical protein